MLQFNEILITIFPDLTMILLALHALSHPTLHVPLPVALPAGALPMVHEAEHPVLEVLLGLGMILMCMMIHSFGMYQVMHRFETQMSRFMQENREFRRQAYFLYLVTLILLTHLIEITMLALVLHTMHLLPNFRTDFYLAGETYTSLGNGDVLLPTGWRQLAMFITMSGLLTFGWTTGVLASIVGKTYDAQFAVVRHKRSRTPKTSQPTEPTE